MPYSRSLNIKFRGTYLPPSVSIPPVLRLTRGEMLQRNNHRAANWDISAMQLAWRFLGFLFPLNRRFLVRRGRRAGMMCIFPRTCRIILSYRIMSRR